MSFPPQPLLHLFLVSTPSFLRLLRHIHLCPWSPGRAAPSPTTSTNRCCSCRWPRQPPCCRRWIGGGRERAGIGGGEVAWELFTMRSCSLPPPSSLSARRHPPDALLQHLISPATATVPFYGVCSPRNSKMCACSTSYRPPPWWTRPAPSALAVSSLASFLCSRASCWSRGGRRVRERLGR